MLSTSSLRRRPSSPSLKSYSNSCSALSKESLHASKTKKRKPSNYGISKETVSTEWMIMLNGEDVTPLPLVPNSESMRKNKLITYDEILKKFPSKANSLPWLFDSNVKESLFGSTSFISSISDQQPQVQVYNEDFNLKVTGKDTPSKVFLCESNTNVLFTIMGSVMSSDTIDYVAVREMNILMERKPKTIEKIDRSTETVYRGVRSKGIAPFVPNYRHSCIDGCAVDISFYPLPESCLKSLENIVQAALFSGYLLDTKEMKNYGHKPRDINIPSQSLSDYIFDSTTERIMHSPIFARCLRSIERVLVQSNSLTQQMNYFGLSNSIKGKWSVKDSLSRLCLFQCNETVGKEPTCMCWYRPAIKDLLVVGYTYSSNDISTKGLAVFWSIRNPGYPEYSFAVRSGVSALALSKESPALLAIGLQDGGIFLYERHSSCSLNLISVFDQRHFGSIRSLRWVSDTNNEIPCERLLSMGQDGKILEWTVSNGFQALEFTRLPKSGNLSNETSMFPDATGLCLDLHNNSEIVAGTADGFLHMVSYSRSSLTEAEIVSFHLHRGPVQQLAFSPFMSNILLTCSSDWTIKLWMISKKQRDMKNALTFQSHSTTDKINSVAWCPYDATIFASAGGDGTIQLWDLSLSTVDPLFSIKSQFDGGITSILFSENAPILVAASETGAIEVFNLNFDWN